MDIPPPSVLLNADAVRAYLDSVDDPHLELPQDEPFQEAYPRQQLTPSKWVMGTSAQRMSVEDVKYYDTREAPLVVVADVQSSMARSRTSTPRTHTNRPRPLYNLKRRASQSIGASSNSLKVSIPLLDICVFLIERRCRSRT
jgi:hypothetical protein